MKTDKQKAIEAYADLLSRLPKEAVEKLLQKYEEEHVQFMDAVEALCPSKELEFWAKPSCHKCWGRGFVGIVDTNKIECGCVSKQYGRWLAEFRRLYNVNKSILGKVEELNENSE